MGDLAEDIERCLCDCVCDDATTECVRCCCEEGRVRETKRVLLDERERLLNELHANQRSIDVIDHLLNRVSIELQPRRGEKS